MTGRRGLHYLSGDATALAGAVPFIDRVFREEFDLPIADRVAKELDRVAAAFDANRDVIEIAENDGGLIGILVGAHDDAGPTPNTRVHYLAVDPAQRGRGVGRELLSRGLESCRQKRLALLRARSLALSSAAPRLFWMFGFRVIDVTPFTAAGRTRELLHFEKRLSPPTASP